MATETVIDPFSGQDFIVTTEGLLALIITVEGLPDVGRKEDLQVCATGV